MATARERLRQLSLAQESAESEAERIQVQPRFSLPSGGGIISRPIRPSAAEGIQESPGTPLTDFGEFFLNQLGITSERQRIGKIESLAAIHSANQAIGLGLQEQVAAIEARGVGGIDAEMLKNSKLQIAKAIELMDNPDPSIQEFGRAIAQSQAGALDQMNKDYATALGGIKTQVVSRSQGLIDARRADMASSDNVTALLNEFGERNGISAELPTLIKQTIADHIGGAAFSIAESETSGLLAGLPGFDVRYDPTDTLTVGDASALIAAVDQMREKSILGSLAKEMQVATRAGLRMLDKDGVLTAEEIAIPELEPDISRLNFVSPPGKPLDIRLGVPDEEDARRRAQANLAIAGATFDEFGKSIGKALSVDPKDPKVKKFLEGTEDQRDAVRRFFGESAEDQAKRRKVRPTND